MTPAEVRARVQEIASMASDDEAAHAAEDDLRAEVLAAVAGGSSDAAEMAAEALKTDEISFERWCA